MIIGALKESLTGENRVALTPDSAVALQKLGHSCVIQSGAGAAANFPDEAYAAVGVEIAKTSAALWKAAEVVIAVRAPEIKSLSSAKPHHTLISFIWPAQNEDYLAKLKEKSVTAIAMDMVPRISRAQKMDALSSMANTAGYRSVIEAGNNFGRFFTGQITAAGKVPPAKVLVIGAGVAGLAAIGTAQALGAIVRAFDVRPEVAEQIESMGAEFLMLDFEDEATDGANTGGYAAPSSPEFIEKEMALFREQAPDVDIVITTAAEQGGNCDLTVAGEKITTNNGVTVVGYTDLPSRMASQSSQLYATNIRHMMDDLTPENDGVIVHNMEDDVIRSATVTQSGNITFPPPPLKTPAIAAAKPAPQIDPEIQKAAEAAKLRKQGFMQIGTLMGGALLMLLLGAYAPASFMQHFIVFTLACFVGYQVIWNVRPSLHTLLMAVTNAISGIIILGAVLQIGSNNNIVIILAALSVLIAMINISGGFLVTRRMLQMFQKS